MLYNFNVNNEKIVKNNQFTASNESSIYMLFTYGIVYYLHDHFSIYWVIANNIKHKENRRIFMSKSKEKKYAYTQNREISWLRFNRRVLEEAADTSVPALERLKFISIFSSNLDEFFMIRVGSLFDATHVSPDVKDSKSGWTPREQLEKIYNTIPGLITLKREIYKAVMDELQKSEIHDLSIGELNPAQMKRINQFFKHEMLPILSPIIIGPHHPIPHLDSKELYVAVLLEDKKKRKYISIIPIPDSVPPYIIFDDGLSYIRTENILMHCAPTLFTAYVVKEACVLCVTRNADISFDDEKFEDTEEDFRKQVTKLLKKRDNLSVVRLELSENVSEDFQSKLANLVKIKMNQVYIDSCPLNMGYVFGLTGKLSQETAARLLYKPYTGRWPEDIRKGTSIIEQIKQKDKLLFYPYDSVEPFLNMLIEAADDPNVLSIKITIYRLASLSRVAQILCRAAENGKEVLALMELRARFDEAHNLEWSKMLEESGCQVIYGIEGFKCHSKICLITRRDHGKTNYITQIGTGNYNEKTNTMYTDLSLMTASAQIGEDATVFFRNMLVNELRGEYHNLWVSPFGIKNGICSKIDEQIKLGRDGYVCIKANSITERDVIDKLCEASVAGVEIWLIIRGICCILPEIPEYTENVHIVSIVGRYLEHARIYMFGKAEKAEFYIASADLMTRNLNRRVEIACPIYDEQVKEQLKWILDMQLKDTAKESFMMSDGVYSRKQSAVPFDSQQYFMDQTSHVEVPEFKAEKRVPKGIGKLFKRLFSKE